MQGVGGKSVTSVVAWLQPAPGFPLRAMVLFPDCAAFASKEVEPASWLTVEFEIDRRRYDTRYSAVWRSLSGTCVPIERAFGSAYRMLLRDRANRLRAASLPEGGPDVARVALETALRVIALPVSVVEAGRFFRPYVGGIPDPAVCAIVACPE